MLGLPVGGRSASKLIFLLAELAVIGVFAILGVFGQCPWAGLGVTLQKSAKLKFVDGVLGWKPNSPVPPGVDIMDDGRGVALDGGVDGACILVLVVAAAGVGEVARYMRRSAPSSPVLGVRDHDIVAAFVIMRRCGGGVCGGEDCMCEG